MIINLYDDSFLTDEIVDAATKAGWEFVLGPDETEDMRPRDYGIVRQSTRVRIAAALNAGLLDKIKEES